MSEQPRRYFVFNSEISKGRHNWVRYEVLSLDPPDYPNDNYYGFVKNVITGHIHYASISQMYRTPTRNYQMPRWEYHEKRSPFCRDWINLPLSENLVLSQDEFSKGKAFLEKNNTWVVVDVLSYDQNKYCQIRYESQVYDVKLGYLQSFSKFPPLKPNGSLYYHYKNIAHVQRWNLPTWIGEFQWKEWNFK